MKKTIVMFNGGFAAVSALIILFCPVSSVNADPSDTVYTQSGGTASKTRLSLSAGTTDRSAVYVTNGGTLVMTNSTIKTSGNTTSEDSSSFYGLNAAVLANAGSTWTVTATSHLTGLSDSGGISGNSIANISGNGHTVYYNPSLAVNSGLGGRTYQLLGGGELTPATTSSAKRLESSVPSVYSLAQNYPNPFNPTTTIRYGLPSRSAVTLAVYNLLGQLIATPVRETQEAGYHETTFNATGLPSGVYSYRIKAGYFVQARRLLVIR